MTLRYCNQILLSHITGTLEYTLITLKHHYMISERVSKFITAHQHS